MFKSDQGCQQIMKRKPKKILKCLSSLEYLKDSISTDVDTLEGLYKKCQEVMRDTPGYKDRPLKKELYKNRLIVPKMNRGVQTCEMLVKMSSNFPKKIANGVVNNPLKRKLSRSHPSPVANEHNDYAVNPRICIKIEDSSSEDSDSKLQYMTEKLVNKIFVPSGVPTYSNGKEIIHYVLLQNLPVDVTSHELTTELFSGLLGIKEEEVLGITVHREKTESIAQLYFHDTIHVQKLLMFSGKLVFKGRVIVSKIGMRQ